MVILGDMVLRSLVVQPTTVGPDQDLAITAHVENKMDTDAAATVEWRLAGTRVATTETYVAPGDGRITARIPWDRLNNKGLTGQSGDGKATLESGSTWNEQSTSYGTVEVVSSTQGGDDGGTSGPCYYQGDLRNAYGYTGTDTAAFQAWTECELTTTEFQNATPSGQGTAALVAPSGDGDDGGGGGGGGDDDGGGGGGDDGGDDGGGLPPDDDSGDGDDPGDNLLGGDGGLGLAELLSGLTRRQKLAAAAGAGVLLLVVIA
jgi:hypothetical protein